MDIKNTREIPEVLSFRTIRRSIGILSFSIPIALPVVLYVLGCRQMQPSISDYYYTLSGNLFVGLLCAVGLFLITYKGFSPTDDASTNLAGVCAFIIALCPTKVDKHTICQIVDFKQSTLGATIHFSAAALFFLTLAFISYFLFTKDKGGITDEKVIRNKIYRICAILMLVFVSVVPILKLTGLEETFESYNLTYWAETGAMFSFGVSWLIKGEVVLEDK